MGVRQLWSWLGSENCLGIVRVKNTIKPLKPQAREKCVLFFDCQILVNQTLLVSNSFPGIQGPRHVASGVKSPCCEFLTLNSLSQPTE